MREDFEVELRAEMLRLRHLAEEWDRRAAPAFQTESDRQRWQCDAWIGACALRDGALRLEEAIHAIALGRLRAVPLHDGSGEARSRGREALADERPGRAIVP